MENVFVHLETGVQAVNKLLNIFDLSKKHMPLCNNYQNSKENLSYLLGALYGDGCFSKDGKVYFCAADKEFVKAVIHIVKKLFSLELNMRKRELSKKNKNWRDVFEFSSRRLYKLLNQKMYIKKPFTIPEFIIHENEKVKASFLRGFFDAEGNVDVRKIKRKDGRTDIIRHVKCFSNNKKLLKEIVSLLYSLKIKSDIFKGKKENFYVCIWNYKSLNNFKKHVGFVIKRKQFKLKKALNSYRQIQNRWTYETYKKVMEIRKKEKIGAFKIHQKMSEMGFNIPRPTIEAWIYGRAKITKRRCVGNA
jgi:intein/homing endonuclease